MTLLMVGIDAMGQQGVARLQFKQLYQYLMPYYIDLRHKHRESRVLLEYGQEPVACGVLLNRLVSFGNCHAVDDWKEVSLFPAAFEMWGLGVQCYGIPYIHFLRGL